MLSFSWHVCIGENDLEITPRWVGVQSVMDIIPQALSQTEHEGCTLKKSVCYNVVKLWSEGLLDQMFCDIP